MPYNHDALADLVDPIDVSDYLPDDEQELPQ